MINRIEDLNQRCDQRQRFEHNAASPVLKSRQQPGMDEFARTQPTIEFAAAAALGLALGWWVKRK